MDVSVVIPTRDRPRRLARLLDSVLAQSHAAFEVIVVDDASGDEAAYRELRHRYVSSRVLFLRNRQRRGAPYSRNRGIEEARFELVALVDDDDWWGPEKLARQVRLFEGDDRRLGLVHTWAEMRDPAGRRLGVTRPRTEGAALREMLEANFICGSSVMARREAIVEAGLFDEAQEAFQDWDMWTRILAAGYRCRVVESVETFVEVSADSISGRRRGEGPYRRFLEKHRALYERLGVAPRMDATGRLMDDQSTQT